MSDQIENGTRIRANPRHVQSPVRDEAVLLQFGSGEYFGLNPIGVRVWELLKTEPSFGELVSLVVAEYDVTPEVAAQDLTVMVRNMERHALVELRNGA